MKHKIVVTNGCYDILHKGHIALLEQAKGLGDNLIVAVNSDRAVAQLKGPGRPIVSEDDRAAVVAALQCVDVVTIVDAIRVTGFLLACGNAIWVKGGDYKLETLDRSEREAVQKCGGSIKILPLTPGYSTTSLVGKITKN